MFELKIIEERPHHYLVGVGVKTPRSSTPGKLYLKYGPIYFHNDDVENVQFAIKLYHDKIYRGIYKVTPEQIYKISKCEYIITTIVALRIASRINDISIHHFSTEFELHDDGKEYFKFMVEIANDPNSRERQLLDKARINM
jgi:hypothetical protein